MTRRRMAAIGVLSVWVGGIGVLAQRELFPDEDKQRERMASLVEPVTYYYMLEKGGVHIGYVTSQIDTSIYGISVRNSTIAHALGESDSSGLTTRFTAQLTTRLRVADFSFIFGTGAGRQQLIARSVGDSALELRRENAARAPADTVPFGRYAVTPEIAPFVLALGKEVRTGDVHELEIFDRESHATSKAQIKLEADSLFVVSDSAKRDTTSGLFVSANSDTVRAWRAVVPGAGGGTFWIDRTGRIVLADLGAGVTMRRTAFQLAFENWRATRYLTEQGASARQATDSSSDREAGQTPSTGSQPAGLAPQRGGRATVGGG